MFEWGDCVDSLSGVATIACVPIVLKIIVNAALALAGATAVVFIIWGGYKYISSGGDPKQADTARKTITYAIVGLIIILLSFGIINFISTVTGVPCIRTFGFDNCA